MIPPAEEAGSAAAKQEVLETYRRPCEPSCPVVCRDEQPARPVQHPLPPQGPGLSPARTTADSTPKRNATRCWALRFGNRRYRVKRDRVGG